MAESRGTAGRSEVGSTVEDYVKVIYSHTEWQPEPITTTVLATRLGLAPSSVTEMVKKLARAGLVTHKPYGAVTLTADGATLATRMVRRHRLIETWLVHSFGYRWDEVHDEAEILEHALSDRLLAAIDAELGHPVRDPHGDPIPAVDGSIARPAAIRLADAPVGASGAVVRISDRDPGMLRDLAARAVTLDAIVTVTGRGSVGGPSSDDSADAADSADGNDSADGSASTGDVDADVDGRALRITAETAAAIWISIGE